MINKNPKNSTNTNTLSINSNNTTSLGSLQSNKQESKEISSADFDNAKSDSVTENNENLSNKIEDV